MRTIKVVLLALVGFIAGGLVFKSGWREFRESRQLKNEGVTVQAKVVEERTRYRSKGRSRYYLTVEFNTSAGELVRKETEVNYETHSQGAASGQVPVHYVPTDPTILRTGPSVGTEFGNMLLGGFILACGATSLIYIRQPTNRKDLAEDTVKSLDALCDAEQQYVAVDGRTFKGVDQNFYNHAQREFESRGFVFLEDIEVIPKKPVKGFTRTFVRLLLGPDRAQVANIFHVKPGILFRVIGAKEARVCGVDTQMSDNSFVCTDNAESCSALNNAPEINAAHLPAASTVAVILDTHASRQEAHCVFRAGAAPVRMHGSEDVRRSMELQNRIKAAFRQQHGLSREELERLAGEKNNEAVNNLHLDIERHREHSRRDAA